MLQATASGFLDRNGFISQTLLHVDECDGRP